MKGKGANTNIHEPPAQRPIQQAGIGAIFSSNSQNEIVFCAAAEGSSSHDAVQRAELQPGDILRSVDGQDILYKSRQEIALRLLGQPGSLVSLTFRRNQDNNFKDTTITMDRRAIPIDVIRKAATSVKAI